MIIMFLFSNRLFAYCLYARFEDKDYWLAFNRAFNNDPEFYDLINKTMMVETGYAVNVMQLTGSYLE